MDPHLVSLRCEYSREGGIGALALAEITSIVLSIVRSPRLARRAREYVEVGSWDQAIDDIVQIVVLEEMLEEGQYIYALQVARSLSDFRGLLGARVHRCLGRMRQRSVIDVLAKRARVQLADPRFTAHVRDAGGRPDGFQLAARGHLVEVRWPTEDEIAAAARNICVIPTLPTKADARSPRVYGPREFTALLDTACESFTAVLFIDSLKAILRLVLTDWIVGSLVSDEESLLVGSSGVGTATAAIEHGDAIAFVGRLSDRDRELLRQTLAGYRDGESAEHFGCTRQTINGWKQELRARLSEHMDPQDPAGAEEFIREVHLLVATPPGFRS